MRRGGSANLQRDPGYDLAGRMVEADYLRVWRHLPNVDPAGNRLPLAAPLRPGAVYHVSACARRSLCHRKTGVWIAALDSPGWRVPITSIGICKAGDNIIGSPLSH